MRSREVVNARVIGKRKIAPENYLIMCEGKETEPNYFNGLKQLINSKYGDRVDVLISEINIKGTGKNTNDLVNYTERFVNQAGKKYGKVWIVFDKDDYRDIQFNLAIKKATDANYNTAWSNPCFEIWLLLHLKSVQNYIEKDKILNELDKEFKHNNLGNYHKNDKDVFKKVTKDDNLSKAITNSKKLVEKFKDKKPSESNPMTNVYKIVEDLKEYI